MGKIMQAKKMLVAIAGASVLVLTTLANPSPAAAAGYTVTWSSSSSYYAYGYAYTSTNCTGSKKTLRIGGTTRATTVRSIKTPTVSDFVSSNSIPLHYHTVPVNKCWKVPETGSWTGYDPA